MIHQLISSSNNKWNKLPVQIVCSQQVNFASGWELRDITRGQAVEHGPQNGESVAWFYIQSFFRFPLLSNSYLLPSFTSRMFSPGKEVIVRWDRELMKGIGVTMETETKMM